MAHTAGGARGLLKTKRAAGVARWTLEVLPGGAGQRARRSRGSRDDASPRRSVLPGRRGSRREADQVRRRRVLGLVGRGARRSEAPRFGGGAPGGGGELPLHLRARSAGRADRRAKAASLRGGRRRALRLGELQLGRADWPGSGAKAAASPTGGSRGGRARAQDGRAGGGGRRVAGEDA